MKKRGQHPALKRFLDGLDRKKWTETTESLKKTGDITITLGDLTINLTKPLTEGRKEATRE